MYAIGVPEVWQSVPVGANETIPICLKVPSVCLNINGSPLSPCKIDFLTMKLNSILHRFYLKYLADSAISYS